MADDTSEWSTKPLTVEDIRAAAQKIKTAPIEICGATYPHVVHPESRGLTMCANCFGVVDMGQGFTKNKSLNGDGE